MVTYKGLPAPLICDFLSREASRAIYSAGTEFHIGGIDMVANTGTYVDSPFHRYADGKDLSELPLESAGPSRRHRGGLPRRVGTATSGGVEAAGQGCPAANRMGPPLAHG